MSRVSKYFGDPEAAGPEGYLGRTPGITCELLLDAYSHGIFPWSDRPARWYSPDPRSIYNLESLRPPRRLLRLLRAGRFSVSFDRSFRAVMLGCLHHHGRTSWISPSMVEAYGQFHRQGYAHSVEVWAERRLVGGLYGVQIGAFFAGESMFHRETDASKVAFFHLVQKLRALGVVLFDSQVLSEHTARLGAFEISRAEYLRRLSEALASDVPQARWEEESCHYQQMPSQDS